MDTFEQQIMDEGGNNSFRGPVREQLQLAFLEQFALAADAHAKRDVVRRALIPGSPEEIYYAALCDLLEVQQVLTRARGSGSAGTGDNNNNDNNSSGDGHGAEQRAAEIAEAARLLESKKPTLTKTVRDLEMEHYCHGKATRVKQRLLLLELELQRQLAASSLGQETAATANTQTSSYMELPNSMGIYFADSAPADRVLISQCSSTLPTRLESSLVDFDANVRAALHEITSQVTEYLARSTAETQLRIMDSYAREHLLHLLLVSEFAGTDVALDSRHRVVLELFLDTFAFECADLNGYLEIITQDVAYEATQLTNRGFGFRTAHQKLSLPQLQQLLIAKPALFTDNVPFAVRGVKLLQAAAAEADSDALDCRDAARRTRECAFLSEALGFLDGFSGRANSVRLALLQQRLKVARLHHWDDPSGAELLKTLLAYVQVPRVNTAHIRCEAFEGVPLEHRVDFGYSGGVTRAQHSQSVSVFGYPQLTTESDREAIEAALYALWATDHVSADAERALAQFLNADFARATKAQCLIRSGKGDAGEWVAHLPRQHSALAGLASTSELAFCESNASFFGPDDELAIHVRVRNTKRLTVHLYELRTVEYYTRVRKEIQGNINLDGLLPNLEQTLDVSHLSPYEEVRVRVAFPQVQARRGVFVVEVLESGQTCRAILRRGFLRHVERITDAGHELLVLDERGEVVRGATALVLNLKAGRSRAQAPRPYSADADGKLLVPFRHASEGAPDDKFAIAFCHDDFAVFHATFAYLADRVALAADLHIDNEQLVAGSTAQLVVRPYLLLEQTRQEISLRRLAHVRLTVKFVKAGVAANSSEEVFEFADMDALVASSHAFEIPIDTESLTATLSARVAAPGSGSGSVGPVVLTGRFASPTVTHSKSFAVQRVTQYVGMFTPHLLRRTGSSITSGAADEFRLLVLGHNGEPMPNVELALSCTRMHFTGDVLAMLRTDANGEIQLGTLCGVQQICARFSSGYDIGTPWTWELPGLCSSKPRMVNCAVGESVEVPVPHAFRADVAAWVATNQVSLYRVVDASLSSPVLERVAATLASVEVVVNAAGESVLLKAAVRASGKYVVLVRPLDLKFPITVVATTRAAAVPHGVLLVQQKQVLLPTASRPLAILSQAITREDGDATRPVLEVQLRNASLGATHVVVTFKRFIDVSGCKMNQVIATSDSRVPTLSRALHKRQPDSVFDVVLFENEYLKKRKISDEYKYILERRLLTQEQPLALRYLGTPSMSKPSLVQMPHVVESTDMEEVVMGAGEQVRGYKQAKAAAASNLYGHAPNPRRSQLCAQAGSGVPSLSFLSQPSLTLSTNAVTADGVARIALADLAFFQDGAYAREGAFEVVVLGIDYARGQVCSSECTMALPRVDAAGAERSTDSAMMTTITKRDVRLSSDEALRAPEHFLQKQLHEVVRAGEQRALPRSSSTKYALYESIDDAMELWNTLSPHAQTRELTDRLREWPHLSLDAKLRFYYANAADDLNVFLCRKDPVFFAAYVRPLVAAKISKSLIDHYLLRDEAAIARLYLAPGVLQELSVVEKLLVAEVLSSHTDAARIIERVRLDIDSASNAKTLQHLFESVLSQGSIKPSEPVVEPALAAKRDGFVSAADDDDDFGVESINSSDDESDGDDDDDEQAKKKAAASKRRDAVYIPPGKVRTVQEKRSFASQNVQLDGRNAFWRAFGDHVVRAKAGDAACVQQGFVSSLFPEALAASLSEGLLALAMLDLPMRASGATEIRVALPAGNQVELRPRSDVVLYHQNIEAGECGAEPNSTLVLKQRITSFEASTAGDVDTATAVQEFIVNTKYTCVASASNVGSVRLANVHLLLQIPHGAIPLGTASFYTKSEVFDVPSNYTVTKTVTFYFPEAGVFEQYPAHAAVDGAIVAWATTGAREIRVLLQPTQVDLTSWSDVSARGSLDDVLGYLSAHQRMLSVDLSPLAWRCHDEAFYRGLSAFLRSKVVFHESIWKYAFEHGDAEGIHELLASSTNLLQSVGAGVETSLFAPTELFAFDRCLSRLGRGFDHTEFGPFLRRRVHTVGGSSSVSANGSASGGARILNKSAREFYRSLCQRLGLFAALDGQHLLVLTYFMILFERMDDALALFARLQALPSTSRAAVECSVQFDYVNAYLDLFRVSNDAADNAAGNSDCAAFAVARRLVAKHKRHPHARWRLRFERLGEFVAEYDHFDAQRRQQAQAVNTGDAPTVESAVPVPPPPTKPLQVTLDAVAGDGAVRLTSQHLAECDVSFHPIDVEFMFSSEPFGTFSDSAGSSSSLLLVRPRAQLVVALDGSDSGSDESDGSRLPAVMDESELMTTVVPIPRDLQSQQMMVRVRERVETRRIETVAAPIDIMRPYFNSSLRVEVLKQSGLVQVFRAGLPVPRCYVKVFVKASASSGGGGKPTTQFYKDGYTDLLGKFDYAGVNGDLLARVERFSLLVAHAAFGASVHETEPPVLATTAGDFQHQEEHELLLY